MVTEGQKDLGVKNMALQSTVIKSGRPAFRPPSISTQLQQPRDPSPTLSKRIAHHIDDSITGLESCDHSPQSIHLGKMVGRIAHDLNNILTALLGHTELASLNRTSEDPSQRHLQKALMAGHRGKELLEQILAFQRGDQQTLQSLELGKVVDEALELLHETLPSTITIHKDDHGGSGRILGNDTQIYQVVINLLSNAVKAMKPRGGSLHIHIKEVSKGNCTVTSSIPEESFPYLHLSITDTGTGMAKDLLDRVFDPYFTTHPQGEGTGLGLAIVKEIITNHDGFILAESEPGKGSTFHVYFPTFRELNSENAPSLKQEIYQ